MPSRSGVAARRSVRAITVRRSDPMSAQIGFGLAERVGRGERAAQRGEALLQPVDPRRVSEQERAGGEEVGVVVAVGLVGRRVHAVRRRREEQGPGRPAGLGLDVVEEPVGELGGEVGGVRAAAGP